MARQTEQDLLLDALDAQLALHGLVVPDDMRAEMLLHLPFFRNVSRLLREAVSASSEPGSLFDPLQYAEHGDAR